MTNASSVVVTGTGAVCGGRNVAGRDSRRRRSPDARRSGRSRNGTRPAGRAASRPRSPISIRARWSTTASCTSSSGAPTWSVSTPRDARSTRSGIIAHRDAIEADAAATYSDRTGVYVGSGGGNYENQYDYFPLFAAAGGELPAFGRELANTVNPMWLLRTLPNNVLGHIGIKHGLKGSNACITNHSVGGTLAVIEAFEALRNGEADRAVAVGHETPIEPQMVLYYQRLGLLATEMLRPFDARHDGSLFGEGARRAAAGDRGVGRGARRAGAGRDPGRRLRLRGAGADRHPRRRRRPRARDRRRRSTTRSSCPPTSA